MVINSEFLSIKEFAANVGVHPNTIRRAIKRGKLAAIRFGSKERSHYRIAKSELSRIALLDMENIIERIIEKRAQEKAKVL